MFKYNNLSSLLQNNKLFNQMNVISLITLLHLCILYAIIKGQKGGFHQLHLRISTLFLNILIDTLSDTSKK